MAELAWREKMAPLNERFASLPKTKKIILFAALAVLIAIGASLYFLNRQPEYKILFSNLSDKDGGTIVATLQQMNVPYQLESGGVIRVPTAQVYEVRLRLASQGIPKGGGVGFELMDGQKLGTSQFTEQVNYQRAVEGELAKSIESIQSVQSARVHLAMPRNTVFLREQQKPSASVVLALHPGRVLDAGQVNGIVHLIASSVPDMPVRNVTIVDQGGNLLSTTPDGNKDSLDAKQLEYLRRIEQSFVKRVEAILEPVVGTGNLKAEATAVLDFAQVEQTSETFKPNSPPEASAIRSQQSVENSASKDPNPAGVPGALTNQPPGTASAPLTLPPGTPASAGAAAANQHKESTVNYEVDKTISHIKQATGTIKRLSVAVVVNHKKVLDKNGATTFVARTPAEIQQITNLVREAMGFNQTRGDSLNVVNAPFAQDTQVAKPLMDKAIEFGAQHYVDILKYGFLAIIVFYLLFGIVRPVVKDVLFPKHDPSMSLDDEFDEQAALEAESGLNLEEDDPAARLSNYAENIRVAKELAKQDPQMVATIVKEWLNKDE